MSTETNYREKFIIDNTTDNAKKYIEDTINYIKYCHQNGINEYDEVSNLSIKVDGKNVNFDEIENINKIQKFECIIEHQHVHVYTMANHYGIHRFTDYKEKNDIKQYVVYNALEYYDQDDEINIFKFDTDTDGYINDNSKFEELEANNWYSYNHRIDITIEEEYKEEFEKILNEYSKLIELEYEVDDMDDELEYTLFESIELKKEQLQPVIEKFKKIYEFCVENEIDIDELVFAIFAEDEDKFEKIEIDTSEDDFNIKIAKIF